jgi:hypothetical protein
MAGRTYIDFDITLRSAGAEYEVHVAGGPGAASNTFPLPFSERELDDFFSIFGGRQVRRMESPQLERARAFGGRLYKAVFNEELDELLATSLTEAGAAGKGLRIRLRLGDAPDLVNIPWEYLYRPASDDFFALSNWTPIIRYLDVEDRMPAADLEPPLKILVMISNPVEYQDTLDVDREWDRLQDAFADLQKTGHVQLKKLERATEQDLQRELRRNDYHIFHFIGHGEFNEQEQDGVLLLEDEHRRTKLVSGRGLGTVLRDSRAMRLVVLNNCEGARASDTDPFSGAAQSLVQKGLPAVAAMQFEVTDNAAIRFAHEFYAGLSDGYPADAALAEGRKNIYQGATKYEFGSPVLYLSADDGVIFNITSPPVSPVVPPEVPEPAADDPVFPATVPAPVEPVGITDPIDAEVADTKIIEPVAAIEVPVAPSPADPTQAAPPGEIEPPRRPRVGHPGNRKILYTILGSIAALLVVVGAILASRGDDVTTTTVLTAQETAAPTTAAATTEKSTAAATATTVPATTAPATGAPFGPVPADPPTVADLAEFEIQIDASAFTDEEWTSRFLYASEHRVFGADTITDEADLSADWLVAWDANFLYLWALVADDVLAQVNQGASLFRGDAVAIYFDSDLSDDASGAQLSNDDFAFFFSALGTDWVRLVPTADGGGFGSEGAITSDPDLEAAAVRSTNGYDVEVRIPWRLLGVNGPQPGQQFRMTLDVSDNDTPGASQQDAMISNSSGRTAARQAFPEEWELLTLEGDR